METKSTVMGAAALVKSKLATPATEDLLLPRTLAAEACLPPLTSAQPDSPEFGAKLSSTSDSTTFPKP